MIKRAVEIGKFQGYKVSNSLQFQILQFADDTILMGEDSWNNLWTIKSVLRGFEMVSGLKINFVKSKLYGINVDERFLSAGSSFLSCRSESVPFKFLGIPVGANPRRRETWRPVVEAMSKRLSSWSSRQLSYGGNGNDISFWNAKWCGDIPFGDLFPNLYAKEVQQKSKVADRLLSGREGLNWRWEWSDALTLSEEQELSSLKELLMNVSLNPLCADRWRWIVGQAGLFSVKSCYDFLAQNGSTETINSRLLEAIQMMWNNNVPSKVSVFGWRLLLEKLPTRDALASKGIITNPHEFTCVFCFRFVENCPHLFFSCNFTRMVWNAIFKWMGVTLLLVMKG
ncbi:unnamed protein product [Trifolium pratense]|uniref:Uncharacterized protein n=1 Tax=Trifolium pratense TaxID=57577 RepID=A0ACB0K5K5_TRIPR|nr:unnamed protein product [Trifolium pratense]